VASRAKRNNSFDESRRKSFVGLDGLFGSSSDKGDLDASWLEVEGDVIKRLLWCMSELSGSVTLSTTRNGNAYAIKVYLGKAYDPMYFDGDAAGREEMATWVDRLVEAVALNV